MWSVRRRRVATANVVRENNLKSMQGENYTNAKCYPIGTCVKRVSIRSQPPGCRYPSLWFLLESSEPPQACGRGRGGVRSFQSCHTLVAALVRLPSQVIMYLRCLLCARQDGCGHAVSA